MLAGSCSLVGQGLFICRLDLPIQFVVEESWRDLSFMQSTHYETYRGEIVAVYVENRSSRRNGASQVIHPVVIDQAGDVSFIPPVSTVDEAIRAAKAEIERDDSSHTSENKFSKQPLTDCGIPSKVVLPLVFEHPKP